MDIEGFDGIISSLALAKELYDIDRLDIVKRQFFDVLSWDGYYENIMGVVSSVFSKWSNNYDEEDETDIMIFEDDVISDYFVYAMEYGKRHKLLHDQNPYVIQAHEEVRDWIGISHCTDWKLLAYTKTKKTAQRSKLLVCIYTSCGCNAIEGVAYGLIQLYSWFAKKCAEFKASETQEKQCIYAPN